MTLRRRALLHPHGDHFTLINIFNAFQQRECGWAGLQGLCVPRPPQRVPHPSAGPTAPHVSPAPPGDKHCSHVHDSTWVPQPGCRVSQPQPGDGVLSMVPVPAA